MHSGVNDFYDAVCRVIMLLMGGVGVWIVEKMEITMKDHNPYLFGSSVFLNAVLLLSHPAGWMQALIWVFGGAVTVLTGFNQLFVLYKNMRTYHVVVIIESWFVKKKNRHLKSSASIHKDNASEDEVK